MDKCAVCNSPNVTKNNPGNDTDIVHKWLCQECTEKNKEFEPTSNK